MVTGLIETMAVAYGAKIIKALIVFFIGRFIIKNVLNMIAKIFEKRTIDKSLEGFAISISKVLFNVLLAVTIAAMIGIEMTSFVAIIGAASFAVGLALQGSLSNFAGGVLILITKPFKVGDYIEAAGHSGSVKEIQVFYTILTTPDNKTIFIPNGNLSNSSSVNYSTNPTRRVDLKFGIGYGDDVVKARELLAKLTSEHKMVLSNPAPMVRLSGHGDSSVDFVVRAWCRTEDYWDVHFDLLETVKLEFDREKISIPYPQMDVHLINQ
ncbi:MAG: mechanosensitive ion channel domain-containing protein [Acidaminobacteraceae bacterium]